MTVLAALGLYLIYRGDTMLLPGIRKHVAEHNWFAVSIDLLIVILGVFLGMQVSNWNASLANRSVAATHLSEIAADLRSHLALHDTLYASALGRIAAVDYIYDHAFQRRLPQRLILSTEIWDAPEAPPVPEDRLNNIMSYVNTVRIVVGSRQAYDSLNSSGHLGLIENRALVRHMQDYYRQYDDLVDITAVFRGFRNESVVDGYAYGVSAFDDRPVSEIVDLARRDERFAAYLRTQREWAILHADLLAELKTETVRLLGEIDAERARIS